MRGATLFYAEVTLFYAGDDAVFCMGTTLLPSEKTYCLPGQSFPAVPETTHTGMRE